jgi:DNA-directed RNA polymerase sigma subunit (sigma70/sigma32)
MQEKHLNENETTTYLLKLYEVVDYLLLNAELTEKEKWVIDQRFGFFSGTPKGLGDIATEYKDRWSTGPITTARVEATLNRALKKIKMSTNLDFSQFDWLFDLLPSLHFLKMLTSTTL